MKHERFERPKPGLVQQAAGSAWHEFKRRQYAEEVECIVTSEEEEVEGVRCTVEVSVKFIPARTQGE